MNSSRSYPRRTFLEKAASITAIGFAAPHLASAADPTPSASNRPNSRIHLGIIGCGNMGKVNLSNCAAHPDVVVTAACDVDENRLDVPIVLSLLPLKLGRSIRFDPQTESIVGDVEATRLAIPEYRSPWKFPKEYLT